MVVLTVFAQIFAFQRQGNALGELSWRLLLLFTRLCFLIKEVLPTREGVVRLCTLFEGRRIELRWAANV